MSSLKKLQDEKLEMKKKEAVFANGNSNVYELRNVSTGNEKHLCLKLMESIKNAKAIDIKFLFL